MGEQPERLRVARQDLTASDSRRYHRVPLERTSGALTASSRRTQGARRYWPERACGTRWMTRPRFPPLCFLTIERVDHPVRRTLPGSSLVRIGRSAPCASHAVASVLILGEVPAPSKSYFSLLDIDRRQVLRGSPSTQGPGAGSRHLYAGCRASQAAGSHWTRPGLTTRPGFDTVPTLSTRCRWFIHVAGRGRFP